MMIAAHCGVLRLLRKTLLSLAALLICCAIALPALAQTPADPAWLRYEKLRSGALYLPTSIAVVGNGELLRTAAGELAKALAGGPKAQGPTPSLPAKNAFVLGRWSAIHPLFPQLKPAPALTADGFWLKTVQRNGAKYWLII